MGRRAGLVAILLVVLAACGGSDPVSDGTTAPARSALPVPVAERHADVADRLGAARARWALHGIADYEMEYQVVPGRDRLTIRMADGEVADQEGRRIYSVNEIFRQLEDATRDPERTVVASFHEEYGYPRFFKIDGLGATVRRIQPVDGDPIVETLIVVESVPMTWEGFHPILERQRARWTATGITDYAVTYRDLNYHFWDEPVELVVEQGLIAGTGTAAQPDLRSWTLDAHFDRLAELAQLQDQLLIQVSFDEDFGFISRYYADWDDVVDEEAGIEVTRFEPAGG